MNYFFKIFCYLSIGLFSLSCSQSGQIEEANIQEFEKYYQKILHRFSIEWTLQGKKVAYPILYTPNITEGGSQYFHLTSLINKIESLEIQQEKLKDSLLSEMRLLIPKYKNSLNEMESNPTYYLISPAINYILKDESIEMRDRLLAISQKLEASPVYFEQAKQNLQNPDLKNTQKAAKELSKSYFYYRDHLSALIRASTLNEDEKQECIKNTQIAALQIKDYLAFCRSIIYNLNENASKSTEISEQADKSIF